MTQSNSIFLKVAYINPLLALPPSAQSPGIEVQVDPNRLNSPGLSDRVLVIRLRLANQVIGISNTQGGMPNPASANYNPPPLAESDMYWVDAMWVERDTNPDDINWGNLIESAPLSTVSAHINAAKITGNEVSFNLVFGATRSSSHSRLKLFSLNDSNKIIEIARADVETANGKVQMSLDTTHTAYFLSAQTILNFNNGMVSLGSPTTLHGIPQAPKTVTKVYFDGKILSATWTLQNDPKLAGPDKSEVVLLYGEDQIMTAQGESKSFTIFQPDLNGMANLSMKINTKNGNIGSHPISAPLITTVPQLGSITVTKQESYMVTVEVDPGPGNETVHGQLFNKEGIVVGSEQKAQNGKLIFEVVSLEEGLVVKAYFSQGQDHYIKGAWSLPEAIPLVDSNTTRFDPGYYLNLQSDIVPYVYTALAKNELGTITSPPQKRAQALYLPELRKQQGQAFSQEKGPFKLETSGNAHLPLKLTLADHAALWDFDQDKIRLDLKEAYNEFLIKVEASGIGPYGIQVIQETISRYMPQTFDELLYYRYGLDLSEKKKAHIDLRPGMILRVMPSNYLFVPGPYEGPHQSFLNGYVNDAYIDYDIGSYEQGSPATLGFDAFISRLIEAKVITIANRYKTDDSQISGVGEAVDLYNGDFIKPFYRLFVPNDLLSPLSPGANNPARHFNLASASSYAELEQIANDALNNQHYYFTGRAILKVCIRVMVNGNEVILPIGTTVANLLERWGCSFPKSGIRPKGLTLLRPLGIASPTADNTQSVGHQYPVRFDYDILTNYSKGASALDMTLLHGDSINFQ